MAIVSFRFLFIYLNHFCRMRQLGPDYTKFTLVFLVLLNKKVVHRIIQCFGGQHNIDGVGV